MARVPLVVLVSLLLGPGLSAQTVDLRWGQLGNPTVAGRVGAFPDGESGLMLSTTLCNVGTGPAPFVAVPGEAHPGTVLGLYRIAVGGDGIERIEQIGASWVFHGFVPLGQNYCQTCSGFAVEALGAGCSDTHSAGIMAHQAFLGPRSEWNAWLGTWTCLGSYFDGQPVNCVQNEFGAGLDPVAHRLAVADADLGWSGAEYLLEALVLEVGEVDSFDNTASHRVTMVWVNDKWLFSTPGADNALVDGPAVLRWGERSTLAGLAPHDGQVALSAAVTDLGGGQWRYEYALYNASLDRMVDSLSLAVGDASSDATFRDLDDDPATDWDATLVDGTLVFSLPAGVTVAAGPLGGPLEFGILYNFGLTSHRPPVDGTLRLGLHLPGPGGDELIVSSLVPDVGPSVWVGPGLRTTGAGTGAPRLSGVAPTPGSLGSITLANAPPLAATAIVRRVPGLRPQLQPWVVGLTTDGSGRLDVPWSAWPDGGPDVVVIQALVVDPAAPGGQAWSNVLELRRP